MNNFNDLAHTYKQLSIEIDQLTKQKEELKEQLLTHVHYQEGTYGDIVVSKVEPEPTFDWKTFLIAERIKKEKAALYYKAKQPYIRVTIKRGIHV